VSVTFCFRLVGANLLINFRPKLLGIGPKEGFVLLQGHGLKDRCAVRVKAVYDATSMPTWILGGIVPEKAFVPFQ
jgi:hypothetical protein